MNITEADILRHRKEGAWLKLAGIASTIVADAEKTATSSLHAVLGGGTRVMLALNHRISNDIDLFIRDPQWIGYLSPRLNANVEGLTSAYEETAVSLKLRFTEGEIDFIVQRRSCNCRRSHPQKHRFARTDRRSLGKEAVPSWLAVGATRSVRLVGHRNESTQCGSEVEARCASQGQV